MSSARTLEPSAVALLPRRSRAATARGTMIGIAVPLAAAVALCFAILPLWRLAGLDALYRNVVLQVAQGAAHQLGILPESKRFTAAIFARVSLEPVLLFVLSLAVVASRLGAAVRIRRYGGLLLALTTVNVVCVVIEAAYAVGSSAFVRTGESLVVPIQFVILDRLRFILYHIGLELWPFAAMALTVRWNARGAPRHHRTIQKVGRLQVAEN